MAKKELGMANSCAVFTSPGMYYTQNILLKTIIVNSEFVCCDFSGEHQTSQVFHSGTTFELLQSKSVLFSM